MEYVGVFYFIPFLAATFISKGYLEVWVLISK